MKTEVDTLRGLTYKLRRMDSVTRVYGDNMSIVSNNSKPQSTFNKWSTTVCYHAVRKSVTMGATLTTHIPGTENPADLMIKILSESKHQYHILNLMHDI